MNENEHNPYDALTSPQQIAVDLRLAGKVYKDIASNVSVNLQEHTIRAWFMNGGACHEVYEWKKKIRAEEREEWYRNEFENKIKDLGREAVAALQNAVNKGNVPAIIKALELAGISQMSCQIQVKQADEGILILREIIEDRRKVAREEREKSQIANMNNAPQTP